MHLVHSRQIGTIGLSSFASVHGCDASGIDPCFPGFTASGPERHSLPLRSIGSLPSRPHGACVLHFSGGCAEHGRQILQFWDGNDAFGGKNAGAFQLSMRELLLSTASTRRMIAALLGKMPTTRVRNLISSLTRSNRLVLPLFFQCGCGKWEKASTSSRASIISQQLLRNPPKPCLSLVIRTAQYYAFYLLAYRANGSC